MDIRIKTVLDFVQSVKGYENSVVAGGSVRDHQLDLEPRDYDFFVPHSKTTGVNQIMGLITKEFKLGAEKPKDKTVEYAGAQAIRGVNEFLFEGKLIDIIGKSLPNDENFGATLVKDFDYGLNMSYYTGLYIDDSNKDFQSDFNRHRMTLLNLESIANLPKSVQKFNAFDDKARAKGYHFRFDSPLLTLKKPKKEKIEINEYEKYVFEDLVPAMVNEVPRAAQGRAAVQNRAGIDWAQFGAAMAQPAPEPAVPRFRHPEIPIAIMRRRNGEAIVELIMAHRRDVLAMGAIMRESFDYDAFRMTTIHRFAMMDGRQFNYEIPDNLAA